VSHNFSNTPFQGDLWDLMEECKHWLPSRVDLKRGQSWVFETWNTSENIFPVRKFSPFSSRGSQIQVGGRTFVAVDNEPLTGFYKTLKNREILPPFNEFFGSRAMPASWKLEAPNCNGWKTGGVSIPARSFGIKLAHLIDAAEGLEGCAPETMQRRFFLGFSPFNVFPFPDSRKVMFQAKYCDENGSSSLGNDPAEDKLVQEVLRGFLRQHYCDEELWRIFCSSIGRRTDEGVDHNWEYTATRITIETIPRLRSSKAA
jgi:hypothetical protein